MNLTRLFLFCLWAGVAGSAEPAPVLRLPGWFCDNAVLLPAEPTGLFAPKTVVLAGEASDPKAVKVVLSAWPTDRLSAEANGEPAPRGGLAPWQISTRKLSETLAPGLNFNLTVTLPPRGKLAGTALFATNLAVGQVWVLGINPARDSHELPELSPAARQRVRVLAWDGDTWDEATGPWLTAEAAERGRLAAFGGLPRAFANAIVRQGAYGEGTQVIGLILRPLSALRLTAQQGADLDRGSRVLAPPGSPQFAAGIEAGFEANGAPGFGAADRFARARANYLAALTEQKREGNPGTAFPVVPWKWQRYLAGESAPVPFRVTGVIW